MIVISHPKLQINVWMYVSGWSGIKNGPLPSPAVLWVVSVRERKPWLKKKKLTKQNFVLKFLLIFDWFSKRKKTKSWVFLNGQHPKWSDISARVSQESILGPLLFIYGSWGQSNNFYLKLSFFITKTKWHWQKIPEIYM